MLTLFKSVIKSLSKAIRHDPEIQKLVNRYPRFFYFIKKRLTPAEKFGLHLTLGTILTIIFIFLFYGVLKNIVGEEPLLELDLRVINLVQIFRTTGLNQIELFFTYLGKWPIIFSGVAILSLIFFLLKLWRYLAALLFSVGGGELFVWIMKNIIERPRPPLINALAPEKSFSFPSGHSFVAFSFYGLIAYFLFREIKNKFLKVFFIILSLFIIIAIGFSRIYLGAHWPSDVFASYAAGAAWLTVLITALEIRRKFKNGMKRPPFIDKSLVMNLAAFLVMLWGIFIVFYFQTHPLKPISTAAETSTYISRQDIPQSLFKTFPRTSETIIGKPMEPINIIIVAKESSLQTALSQAGWFHSDPITPKVMWRLTISTFFGQPYPEAPAIPSFWNARPNDFSYGQPTAANSVGSRHHLHLWTTPFIVDQQKEVWFCTPHFDKEIKSHFLPIHTIDPAIDKERDKIKNDLLATGKVETIEEFQIIEPTLGKNQAGDQFFTDGKAYIIFLKD